ncbi:cupredoxin domain-containing protein [Paenibacillus solisilvae]|uniref:Cupredoxin domain-containing protein n=1 Tax=Paenibacillus solisilvae TaxID=2486751 RepID=A0ABW0W3T9_9BACL
MSKIFIVSRKQLRLFSILLLVVIIAAACLKWNQSRAASALPQETRIFQLVTGEFSSTTDDGKEIEVYRWDPGSITVHQGDHVELHITGVNGKSHPFVIEELGIKGEVTKGKTTIVRFTATAKGTFPIVCLTHTTMEHGGPMVGYIYVQ